MSVLREEEAGTGLSGGGAGGKQGLSPHSLGALAQPSLSLFRHVLQKAYTVLVTGGLSAGGGAQLLFPVSVLSSH